MEEKLNAYEISALIGYDILPPILLNKVFITNCINFRTYEYKTHPQISRDEVLEIKEWRSILIRTNDVIPQDISFSEKKKLISKLKRKNLIIINDWRISLFREELGPFISVEKRDEVEEVINYYLKSKIKKELKGIAINNNISSKKMKNVMRDLSEVNNERRQIDARTINNELIKEKGMVLFSDIIQNYCLRKHISITKKHIDFILNTLMKNDFFGIPYKSNKYSFTVDSKREYLIQMTDDVNNIISFIIRTSCKRFIRTETLSFFTALLHDKPKTLEVYHNFIRNEKERKGHSYNDIDKKQILCELILLPCEINDADEEIINEALENIGKRSKKTYCRLYNLFMYSAKFLDCTYCSANIYFMDLPKERKDVEPYPLDTYMRMAYLVFNREYIERNRLFEKVVGNKRYAQVWLYVAMHYFAMWRRSDILDIPLPIIENDIFVIIEMIKSDELKPECYKRICDTIVSQVQTMVTNKTGEPLVLDIPTETNELVGKLVLVCEYHREKEGNTKLIELDVINKADNFIDFFGATYTSLFGKKIFSNRKANKSYANSITRIIETSVNKNQKVMGYLIVSYARSHKGDIDSLAPTTMHYLEYKSDGFSPDQFLTEIFSCGAFGFMLDTLLQWVLPYYDRLSLQNQSMICKMLGISAYEIDTKISGLKRVKRSAKKYLEQCYGSIIAECDIQRKVAEFMDNIANRNYTSKEQYVICCRTAAEGNCRDLEINKDTDKCRTCKDALFHRLYLYEIVKEMQESYYIVKNTEDSLVKSHNIKILKSLKNIYWEMNQELIKRYDYDVELLDYLVKGGSVYDTVKRIY